MPDIDVSAPDIADLESLDAEVTPYRRRVALLVVGITLLASVVGYGQAVESNREDRAARDAQRASVAGLGSQIEATSEFQKAYSLYTQSELLELRRILAVQRRDASLDADVAALPAQRLAAARDAVGGESPLVVDDEFNEDGDPRFPVGFDAEVQTAPNEASLRQERDAELADGFGSKADTYVAILTILAVSLFLLGLSLTVLGRSRSVLIVPGAGIAAVCLVWAGLTASGDVPGTPDGAIEQVAEGDRRLTRGDFTGAIGAYDRAIELRDDYATAYGRRADAEFLAGAPVDIGSGFVSTTEDDRLERAIEDGERAVELGADDQIGVVGSLGFFHFLDGDFDAAARFTNDALELNDALPNVWFNLAVIEVARGEEEAAEEYYRIATDLTLATPSPGLRSQLFASARTDLGLAADLAEDADDVEDLVERFSADLAVAEASERLGELGGRADDVDLDALALVQNGFALDTELPADAVPDGTSLALIYHFRPDSDQPFTQVGGMNHFLTFPDEDQVFLRDDGMAVLSSFNGGCLPAGEYRVEAFVGRARVGEAELTIEEPSLGALVEEIDDTIGVSACVPDDWEATTNDEGILVMLDPTATSALNISRTFLVFEVPEDDAEQLDDLAVVSAEVFGTPVGDPEPALVGNLTGVRLDYESETSIGAVLLAIDDEDRRVLRTITIDAPDVDTFEAIRLELLPQVGFF